MKTFNFDKRCKTIFLCMLLLCVIGCIMVYSASFYSAGSKLNNPTFYFIKQIIGVAIGLICFFFFCFFDYKKFIKLKWWIVGISVLLLLLVFVPFIGVTNYGATRWIGFGGITIQPSEIAKFALVIFLACHYSKNKNMAKKLKTSFLPLLVGGFFCILVILEPNMSITMCLGIVLLVMMFASGLRGKYFLCIAIPAILGAVLLIVLEPYRMMRLVAFLDPWANPQGEGFQLIQSLYSLGNGNLFGVGLFSSRQSFLYLPFAESDFIFAIICEELGFFGALLIISIFFVLIYNIYKISLESNSFFASLLTLGIASVIFVQVALNIAVVTGTIPPTGLPLPLISAGSTSLMVFMSAIGITINVHNQNKKFINNYIKN